jgi:hypothetical protein
MEYCRMMSNVGDLDDFASGLEIFTYFPNKYP